MLLIMPTSGMRDKSWGRVTYGYCYLSPQRNAPRYDLKATWSCWLFYICMFLKAIFPPRF